MPQDLLNMNTTNHGVDVQFPWEIHPQRDHDHTMSVGPFYMDKYPVTNERYAVYLTELAMSPRMHVHICSTGKEKPQCHRKSPKTPYVCEPE